MTSNLIFDRRGFIGTASLALAGCATCKIPSVKAGVSYDIGDAHAHFFNLADLPVRNFIRHVFIPEYFPDLPDIALALVDIAVWATQKFAKTATKEIDLIDRLQFGGVKTSADAFGREIKLQQEAVIQREAASKNLADENPETSQAASHIRLSELLGAAQGTESLARKSGDPGAARVTIDAGVYSDIASGKSGPQTKAFDALLAGRIAELRATIKWIYDMIQLRCVHVSDYLETISPGEAKVGHAINLLVDYDRWLGEAPKEGSGHEQQVAFWTGYSALARRKGSPLQLHTFAGYDPLKHAGERLSGEVPSFDTMLGWVDADADTAQHRIAGFKLYPPMGFRPSANGDLSVIEGDRAAAEVRKFWTWGDSRIGPEIDASLEIFFRECTKRDIPMLAHAADSQEAMPGAGKKASPEHWIERAKVVRDWGGNPLRVCLGHFHETDDNGKFLAEILELNRPRANGVPGARIYVDMSFDDDVLGGNAKAVLDFYAEACLATDDDGRSILFGTDWIMLGRKARAGSYLATVRTAAADHSFWGDKVDRLFGGNLRDFLKLPQG